MTLRREIDEILLGRHDLTNEILLTIEKRIDEIQEEQNLKSGIIHYHFGFSDAINQVKEMLKQ